jgi:ATP-dependent DNA ligase
VAAINPLAVRSCIIDGEAVACDGTGLADFQLVRRRRRDEAVTLLAFDLIEINGRYLPAEPIEVRKAELVQLLNRLPAGPRAQSRNDRSHARSCFAAVRHEETICRSD